MINNILHSFLIFNFFPISLISYLRYFGIPIFIGTFLILSSAAFAGLETGGYYENTLIVVAKRTGGGTYGDLNQLRFRMDASLLPNINIHLEPEGIS